MQSEKGSNLRLIWKQIKIFSCLPSFYISMDFLLRKSALTLNCFFFFFACCNAFFFLKLIISLQLKDTHYLSRRNENCWLSWSHWLESVTDANCWLLWNICVTNDHIYVPLVASTSRSFSHSWLIIGFVTRLTRQLPLVKQELLTLPERPSSTPYFSRIPATRSLVLCVCFVDHCLSFCTFFLYFILVLSVLLQYTDSNYTFDIFQLII